MVYRSYYRSSRYSLVRIVVAIAVAIGVIALVVVIVMDHPHSSSNLQSYNGEANTVVLQPGQQLALSLPQGKASTDWVVSLKGTTVHIDETDGIPNSHYSQEVSGSEANPTNIQISGWTALSTSFYAWLDPNQQGAVVVKWPYGWNKL